MKPMQMIFEACGKPEQKHQVNEIVEECLVCGSKYDAYIPEKKAISKTDNDRDRFEAHYSDKVCSACYFCSSGKAQDTFRMWTIVGHTEPMGSTSQTFVNYLAKKRAEKPEFHCKFEALEHSKHIHMLNKSDLSKVVETLCNPPDCGYFVSIADSGQVHTLRWAPMNYGNLWTIQFERAKITEQSETFSKLLYSVATLRNEGITQIEILTGDIQARTLIDHAELWFSHAEALEPYHNSDLIRLALFVCTKAITETNIDIAKRGINDEHYTADLDTRGRGIVAGLLGIHQPEDDQPEDVLVASSESVEDRSGAGNDVREDGERDAQPADGLSNPVYNEVQQQNLFDW